MAKAADDDIVNAFEELPDATGWDNPRSWSAGGNVQLARAFGTFAKDHVNRAVRIISRLDAANGTRAAAYAVDSLSEAAGSAIVADLIRDVVVRGFDGEEFRHSIARALDRMARRDITIDVDMIELLERWVANPLSFGEDDGEAIGGDVDSGLSEGGDEASIIERSSLWGHGGFGAFPGGDVPVADAVVHIRLLRGEAAQAIEFLSDYVDRQKDIRAWDIMARYLPHLQSADQSAFESLLDKLLVEVAGVVASKPYAQFLAWAEHRNHELVERHIDAWRAAASDQVRQAYGEIVALDALMRPEHDSSVRRLERITTDPAARAARAGAALSAAHVFVEEPSRRDPAAALIAQLLGTDEAGAWAAVLELFRLGDELAADEATRTVLRALNEALPRAPKIDATFIVDRLATLPPYEAALVGEIALKLVAKWGADLGDIRTATAMATSALVDLSITLHRLGPETREIGLKLFEQLIDIDAYEARQTLDEIDNRFRQNAPLPRRRLRRRSEVSPRRPRRGG